MQARGSKIRHSSVHEPEWAHWSDEQILNLRMCDLQVRIKGSQIAKYIKRLYAELESRRITFRPHFWLADDWYTPDGVPGIAVPFYMAHPRLARLELNQMREVEGGTQDWCMRILRHEAGHAIENAYRLRRRRHRQKIFGKSSKPYPECYTPKPYSKRFVLHLDMWYAQSHPDEDFAETFAVWLEPGSNWEERYVGWPALKKLRYMDNLIREIAGISPLVILKNRVDPLRRIQKSLREHYKEKRERYGMDYQNFYERDLRRLFSADPADQKNQTAVNFLKRIRKEVRRKVSAWTGAYQYTIDQVLKDMMLYCRRERLRLAVSEEQARVDFTILLTVHTMNYLHSGDYRVAL